MHNYCSLAITLNNYRIKLDYFMEKETNVFMSIKMSTSEVKELSFGC